MKSLIKIVILLILLIPLVSITQQTRFVAEWDSASIKQTVSEQTSIEDFIYIFPTSFTGACIIKITVPEKQNISADIYNSNGVKLKSLVNNEIIDEPISIIWNGVDEKGNQLPDGIYFVVLNTSRRTITQKIVKKKSMN